MEKYYNKALELDKMDSLAGLKYSFVENEDLVYLDGNSLGRMPVKTADLISQVTEGEWGQRLIRSWNEGWIDLPRRIAAKIAIIVGAGEDEIFVGDTTSLNLYKLAFSVLHSDKERNEIVSDELNFPTDLYVLQGLINYQFKNHVLSLARSKDGMTIDYDSLKALIGKNTSLLTLSYVAFKSSFMYDMQRINDLARDNGAKIIWDLSHATGAVPVNLNENGAEMAVGCTYKYLNGGPGSPAFLYIRKDLQEKMINPVSGWFAHEKPFDFNHDFKQADDIRKFGIGTPSILSMAAIEPGLDIIIDAGVDNLRRKSLVQSRFLIEMIREHLLPLGFELASPIDDESRGSHISVRHKEGYRINRAMIEPVNGAVPVIPDFRPPDNIRLGIAPLYNSFMDLFYSVERMKQIVEDGEFNDFNIDRLMVT